MFALVEIAGQQFEVKPSEIVKAPFLNLEPGSNVEFTKVLLASDDEKIEIGKPYIEGKVGAEILEHIKDKKVLVFHKKKRKGYRKLNGHRQLFTNILINNFEIPGFEFKTPSVINVQKTKVENSSTDDIVEPNFDNEENN